MKTLILIIVAFIGIAQGAPYENGLKIVGGEPTDISKHPWEVSIRDEKKEHLCGGFLISPEWVVTAAHCAYEKNVLNFTIRAGSSNNTVGGQIVAISKAIIHPTYPDTYTDIALLLLATPIDNPNVSPASLPEYDQMVTDGQIVTVSGWGRTRAHGPSSSQLLEVQVPVVSWDICSNIYDIPDTVFCAGYYGVGGKDSCQGDSGGPAELDGKVVGIVSGGDGCAEPNFPGVYTRVSKFRNWIRDNTQV